MAACVWVVGGAEGVCGAAQVKCFHILENWKFRWGMNATVVINCAVSFSLTLEIFWGAR